MEAKKLLFVYNSKSGKGKIKASLSDILEIFTEHGYEVTVHPTCAKKDATDIIKRKGNDYDLLVCSGGDGTLDEAVEGIVEGEINTPLGYIPAGSTNDYARSLNIPSDMKKAALICVEGKAKAMDVGSFNGKYFIYVVAFGAFTDVSYATNQEMKNLLGHSAYVFESVRSFSETGLRQIPMTIIADNQIVKDNFAYGMIANSKSVGGMKSIGYKESEPDDGLFEGVFIKYPEDPASLNAVVACLVSGEADPELMYFIKAKEFVLRTRIPEGYTVDGENGGSHSEIEVKVLKNKVKIVV